MLELQYVGVALCGSCGARNLNGSCGKWELQGVEFAEYGICIRYEGFCIDSLQCGRVAV